MKQGVLVVFLICGGGAQIEEGSGDNIEDIVEDIIVEDIDENISDIVADIVEASGDEIGSGDEVEPIIVTNSASYSMASLDGQSTATIILQAISGSDKLNLVCDFSSTDESMFSDKSCVPSIYIVFGHSSCASLPSEVNAKKLADIEKSGQGEVLVEASWGELPGKCVLILREASCGDSDGSGSGDTNEDIVENNEENVEESDPIIGSGDINNSLEAGEEVDGSGDDDGSGDVLESMDGLFIRTARRYRYNSLRSAGLGRSYGTISLAGFSILSSGSTSE